MIKHLFYKTLRVIVLPLHVLLFSALLLGSVTFVLANPETIVRVEPNVSSAIVGDKLNFNITILDVSNLYGLEVNLHWNSELLQLANIDIRLGVESHPDGVLHESFFNISQESDNGYLLAATSIAPAPSFYGSGTVVIVTFLAVNSGEAVLDLETQLYDYPPPDREPPVSLLIEHSTIDGLAMIVIPEFPTAFPLAILFVLTTFVVLSKRISSNPRQGQNTSR